MVQCPNCGNSNRDVNRFCMNCGAPLDKKMQKKTASKASGEQGGLDRKRILLIGLIIVMLVAIVVLLVAVLWMRGKAKEREEQTASRIARMEQEEDEREESEAEESETAEDGGQIPSAGGGTDKALDLSGIDLDGVTKKSVTANGLLTQEDGDFYLELKEAVSIAGYNDQEEIKTIDDVEVLLIRGKSLEQYESSVVTVEGTVAFDNAGEAYLTAKDIEVNEDYAQYTGHSYDFVIRDATWWDAQQDAGDRGGYLVNIDSMAEMQYLLSEIKKKGYENKIFFLGAMRDYGSYQYYWVDEYEETYGESINPEDCEWLSGYWMDGEPSFDSGEDEESYVDMFQRNGEWVLNDVPNDIIEIVPTYSGKVGYIIEYD